MEPFRGDALLKELEELSGEVFLRVFRRLMGPDEYPYPDEEVIKERYAAALVLLADVPHEIVKRVVDEETRKPNHAP